MVLFILAFTAMVLILLARHLGWQLAPLLTWVGTIAGIFG